MAAKKKKKSAIEGRSWQRGEVTLDEIRRLTKPFGAQAESLFDDDAMDGCAYDVIVVDGALELGGDFYTFDANLCGLVVQGDFSVEGVYSDTDDPATGVYVLGSMRAGGIVTTGALGVKKNLETDALVGFYNDYSAMILGAVKTQLFVPENHFFDVRGKLACKNVLGDAAIHRVPAALKKSIKPMPRSEWAKKLDASVLEEGELDQSAIRERVLSGKSVLR